MCFLLTCKSDSNEVFLVFKHSHVMKGRNLFCLWIKTKHWTSLRFWLTWSFNLKVWSLKVWKHEAPLPQLISLGCRNMIIQTCQPVIGSERASPLSEAWTCVKGAPWCSSHNKIKAQIQNCNLRVILKLKSDVLKSRGNTTKTGPGDVEVFLKVPLTVRMICWPNLKLMLRNSL